MFSFKKLTDKLLNKVTGGKYEKKKPQGKKVREKMEKCPRCGKEKVKFNVCSYCGYSEYDNL